MSFNQSRSEKYETLYKKTGRSASSNQHRTSSGAHVKVGCGGPAPSPSSSSISSNRSCKKANNAQGGQSRVNVQTVNYSDSNNASAPRNALNGAHVRPPLHGASDVPVASSVVKPTDASATHSSTRAVPRAPTSQSANVSSDASQSSTLSSSARAPSTPVKAPGDASKAFAFQFGSISPGFMNGVQIPARTSSAPPNLDEQKCDQSRRDTLRPAAPLPVPAPKGQSPRKGVTPVDQSNTQEARPVLKAQKDTQVSPAPPASQTQKPSVLPIPMTSMQMPFHQQQVPLQFGGPNPQIQSHGVTATSVQMPRTIPLPMGSASQVQQPVFVPALQGHSIQPQGILHQAQGLSFTTQMGPRLPPSQLGNLGMGISSQYPQQQGGNFGGLRKTTVKITDPKTNEELRLDKRTDAYADSGPLGLRSHPNMPPQSQSIPSFAASHPINYYPSPYNASNVYFSAPSSLSLASGQMTPNSQPPGFNYPVSQGPQNVSFMNPSARNSQPVNKSGTIIHGSAEPVNLEHARDVHTVITSASTGTIQVTVKPAAGSVGEKVVNPPAVEKSGSQKSSRPFGDSSHPQQALEPSVGSSSQHPKFGIESLATKPLPATTKQSGEVTVDSTVSSSLSSVSPAQSEESMPIVNNAEGRKENLSSSNSIKDHQKKSGKKEHVQPQHQIVGQWTSASSLPSRTPDYLISPSSEGSETVEAKTLTPLSAFSEDFTESVRDSVSTSVSSKFDKFEAKVVNIGDGFSGGSSETSGAGVVVGASGALHHVKQDDPFFQGQLNYETPGTEEQGEKGLSASPKQNDGSFEIFSAHITSKSADLVKHTKEESGLLAAAFGNEVPTFGTALEGLDEPVTCHTVNNRISESTDVSTSRNLYSTDAGRSHGDHILALDASSSKSESGDNKDVSVISVSDQQFAPVPAPDPSEETLNHAEEDEELENTGSGLVIPSISGSKDKQVELTRSKSPAAKSKKKRKEILQKADAAGTTSDLYMAYKGPEEKKDNIVSSEVLKSTSTSSNLKEAPADAPCIEIGGKKAAQNKGEPDDWEDAADMATPKLETSGNGVQAHGVVVQHDKDGNTNAAKMYSRDFLLKFSEQCTILPEDFEMTSDIAGALMIVSASHLVDHDSYPSPGRVIDRSNSGSRVDRRVSSMGDDDRWNKQHGTFGAGRDLRVDIGYGGNASFRSDQGGNYGVLRNPRAQTPGQYVGGILSGPMQSMGPQGGMQRNSPDGDRWQRAASFQHKGLFPSPQASLQMIMHKAGKKYEVGKVTDEEEAKQRQLKAILNKLTPQNFEKLFEQVKAVNIDNAVTLTGVISQIFDKTLMEPTFCEMYANLCHHLAEELPDLSEDEEKITFKRLLLNKCQEEFERGVREQEEANKADEEGVTNRSEQEREEKRIKARRRMLGNIRLIGELYKKKMLTERIMHECIKKLLAEYPNPDEEDVESLCKLMSTIGEMIDHPIAKEHMDKYFERMAMLANNMSLSSRVRFMLKDAIDLRKNKWQQRRKVEGPKKIEEVHRDAAQERQQQSNRLSRNSSMNPSTRRAPMDFGPRGSYMLSSPNAQISGFRGLPTQVRGFGNQDVRFEERQSYEARTMSVLLPQRPLPDDSITLGPQGGLARGMSIRGPPAIASTPLSDISPVPGDLRKMTPGLNGFSTMSERPTYGRREDIIPRSGPDRFAAPAAYDPLSAQDPNMSYVSRDPRNMDRGLDKSFAPSQPVRAQGPVLMQNIPQEKAYSEERLGDMSMEAIKEFYSAKDEEEVALCVKDLNSPRFHPSMISLWVTDSFERKDMERDLLARLIVNLTRSQDGILTPAQLMKGFELVLTFLEDAVNDAPRAPEFLGLVFARVVAESVVPLREIGRILHDGGEERGSLLEIGLAGDVLGSTLEIIKVEKGESFLEEILSVSNLRLEDFRHPDPNRSRMLEKFI